MPSTVFLFYKEDRGGNRVVVGFNEIILQHVMNEVGDSFLVGVWIAIWFNNDRRGVWEEGYVMIMWSWWG